jgi:hypothetical protein
LAWARQPQRAIDELDGAKSLRQKDQCPNVAQGAGAEHLSLGEISHGKRLGGAKNELA